MDLNFAFFADSAVVPPDGKLYVLGGGFSALSMAQLPGRVAFAVVAGFRFGAADVGQAHQVELRLLDAQGKLVIAPASLQFQSAGATARPGAGGEHLDGHDHAADVRRARDYTVEFWTGGQPTRGDEPPRRGAHAAGARAPPSGPTDRGLRQYS